MRLAQILYSQGFGSRRACAALVVAGQARIGARVVDDPDAEFDTDGLVLTIQGRDWPYREHALLLLHKPAGYECSRAPRHHASVLGLLPEPLRRRGVQPVGRLDQDTTGLLLLTDDGALNHRLSSPRHHVAKVYEVGLRHAADDAAIAALLDGVVLHDDPAPVRALACERRGARALRLTIAEGRYHQVKRMIAAVGNRVETLHRSGFGPWTLPAELACGQWCWVSDDPAPSAAPAARD
ncbi:MAG: pseudouridine synthase [Burkholderiales bacterium]|nr:pseudouridine synthase [Burkholderiales bacterium]MDE2161224.1 pseudouridine synthase [Burkholderiales bacterium]